MYREFVGPSTFFFSGKDRKFEENGMFSRFYKKNIG